MGISNQETLVLNRSWMAVQITSVKRAIALLYQGHARVVDEDFQSYTFQDWSQVSQQMVEIGEDDFICSPNLRVRIPRVIVLMFYDKIPQRSIKFSRKNIFERDKYTCQYCGIKPPNKKRNVKWLEKNNKLNGLIIHGKKFPGWEDLGSFISHILAPPAICKRIN